MNKTIALFLISFQIFAIILSKATPKASDLSNHYGTDINFDKFGPKAQNVNLRREGVAPGMPVTPISNFNAEINPKAVTSGDLDNTAFDASRIVKPEIASPKAEIKSKIHHETIIKTPVHLGTQFEENTTTTFNRLNGKIDTKTLQVEKPILGLKNEAINVVTDHTTVVDLITGKVIAPKADTQFHGTK